MTSDCKHKNLSRSLIVVASVALIAVYAYFQGYRGKNILKTPNKIKDNKMSVTKEFFMIAPTAKATATVIFLHGLGDTGNGWSLAFNEFKKKHVRYIFPNAPSIPVSLNAGMVMPAWYDIRALNAEGNEDKNGIEQAAEKLRQLIYKETSEHGIPSNRIILGGFSMGGALALYTALTHPETLGGVIALSSYLPLHKTFMNGEKCMTLQKCPIFQGHGAADPMVSPEFGKLTHGLIKSARRDDSAKLTMYPGVGHSSCDEELDDVRAIIDKWVP